MPYKGCTEVVFKKRFRQETVMDYVVSQSEDLIKLQLVRLDHIVIPMCVCNKYIHEFHSLANVLKTPIEGHFSRLSH